MSSNVHTSQASVQTITTNSNHYLTKPTISKKWELAQRVSVNSTMPNDILEQIIEPAFQSIISDLEEHRPTSFEPTTKERVWNNIKNEALKIIKKKHIDEICDKILLSLNDTQAAAMLEDKARRGKIADIIGRSRVQQDFVAAKDSIKQEVVKMVVSMEEDLRQKTIVALQKEDCLKALQQAEQKDSNEERCVEPQLAIPKARTTHIIPSEASDDD